jgi:hypothetical protein
MREDTIAIDYEPRVHAASQPGQPIGYLLMRVHRVLRALTDESLRPHGFTMPQVAVLFALEQRSGLSTADLARLAFVTPPGDGRAARRSRGQGVCGPPRP